MGDGDGGDGIHDDDGAGGDDDTHRDDGGVDDDDATGVLNRDDTVARGNFHSPHHRPFEAF